MSQPARKIKCYTLCQDGFYKVSVNVRQPEVAPLKPVRELFVRDAEEMQHGGMQVVHVNDVLDCVIAEVIRRAVGDTTLDTGTGEPHGEGFDVVVAPVALRHRGTPEFAAVDDERIVEHAALPEVCD